MEKMNSTLKYNTVTPQLLEILHKLMECTEFNPFRLVGGTALSLQLGHRLSVDIDLFSDYEYGTIDFNVIEKYLKREFNYFDTSNVGGVAMGRSYYIGDSAQSCIKLDLYYTDKFIQPYRLTDNIRLATIEEIAAMKLDVIARSGRKKDYWDIHEIATKIPISKMLELHKERYPYTHNQELIITKLHDFRLADNDFDPICLLGKYWEIIKLDISDLI